MLLKVVWMSQIEISITEENFAEVASKKIIRILTSASNDSVRAWALKFLRKASMGFSTSDHEPWMESLSAVESSRIILSNCDLANQNLESAYPSMTSALPLILNHPLQFNPFVAAVTCLLTKQIEESQQSSWMLNGRDSRKGAETYCGSNSLKTDLKTFEVPGCPSFDRSVGCVPLKRLIEDDNYCGPSKKRRKSEEPQFLKTDESLRFLKQVWIWVKNGHVQLDVVLLGDVLSLLPECIEEVVISWVREELSSCGRRNTCGNLSNSLSAKTVEVRDVNPCDDDILHSLSILQESPILVAAIASSPRLFQQISSILNQLLIQASECSCSLAPLLSLSKALAHETAKGRAEFYPLQIQPLILLLNEDPNGLANYGYGETISSHITDMFKNLPTEIMIAVLSHFPSWLPFLNFASLL
ncbi:uncharacterized protein LOC124166659 isoform X3 [Ischnura elegans]|uniref:uncharacterized protein LOC124166659 isoform X3 n=1 Tax=Ischnura elegans TaxID=197161 RepID=UPI001ED88B49|nr:uncharacterized protein LOC124166659 isoform X3 [Ischnura elegans]